MMQSKELLNAGYIRLVDHMGDDLSIVRAARVSYNAEPRHDGSDEKLIGYLMRNKHTSPFEAVTFTFEIKAPIFVFRQWHRHRTWSFNEISARYAELPEEYYVPNWNVITTQSSSNKQMRTETQHPKAAWIASRINIHCEEAFNTYHTLLAEGCPRELARSVLPVGTYSKMFASVDLHNLMHFMRLRLHEHAQYEIRVYAEAILELIEPYVPVTVRYFKESLNVNI